MKWEVLYMSWTMYVHEFDAVVHVKMGIGINVHTNAAILSAR